MITKKTTQNGRPRRKRITFQFKAGPECDVRLAGCFNGWDPDAGRLIRREGDGMCAATVLLAPGRYEYKFRVDGEWRCDPDRPDRAINGLGTWNSVIEVA